jgi:hypothetical protein
LDELEVLPLLYPFGCSTVILRNDDDDADFDVGGVGEVTRAANMDAGPRFTPISTSTRTSSETETGTGTDTDAMSEAEIEVEEMDWLMCFTVSLILSLARGVLIDCPILVDE